MTQVFVAGGTGNLGSRIVRELLRAGASVKMLVRSGSTVRAAPLARQGVEVIEADLSDHGRLVRSMAGSATLVSALQGLEPVIIDGQRCLLRAAEEAGVEKFIPSDFSLDFFKTQPGSNRNLDLRRRFDAELDASGMKATSILNGAFMDLLAVGAGDRILDHKRGRVSYFGDGDQPLDFTTMDDVAAFTAQAALELDTPRLLRVSGDRVTPRTLAAAAQRALGRPVFARRVGGLGLLRTFLHVAKVVAPGKGQEMPVWQGMQYAENMFSGAGLLSPLDNGRYPQLSWKSVEQFLR